MYTYIQGENTFFAMCALDFLSSLLTALLSEKQFTWRIWIAHILNLDFLFADQKGNL